VVVFLLGAALSQPPEPPPPPGTPGGPGGPGGLERILDEMKLTRQERDRAQEVLRAHHEKMRKLHEEAREDLLKQMKDVLSEEQVKQLKEELDRRPPPGPPGPGRGPRGVPVEDLVERVMAFDKNGDGKVTREELPERMHHLLELGDTNKDGALDKEELKKLAEKLRQEGPPRGPRGQRGPGGRGEPPPPPPPPPPPEE
jgi:hypothetical protein